MIDDFVKKAFDDATTASFDAEFGAFRDRIAKQIKPISIACGAVVGLDEMEKLAGAIIKAGCGETFAEWTNAVMTIAFSEGYKARSEEVG